jgi:hypothetical protein
MDALLDRFRTFWDGLHDRERRMLAGLGIVLGVIVLLLPLVIITTQNQSLSDESDELREALASIEENRAALALQEDARKTAETRYRNITPPLGSFIESEASKYQLALFEVTEQPEKTEGSYHRRAIRAGINEVDLTGAINLLNGIVTSAHPVAIDHIQIEHPQSGDNYRLKLGVLTFDRKAAKAAAAKPAAAADKEEAE